MTSTNSFPTFPISTPAGAIKVTKQYFAGGAHLQSDVPGNIADVVRGLAVDNARLAIALRVMSDVVNNSGGSVGASISALPLPAEFDAHAAGGVQVTNFNTVFGGVFNAQASTGWYINVARQVLGLPLITWSTASFSGGTIPAVSATVTGASGATTPSFVSALAALSQARNNMATLIRAMNEVAAAVNEARLTDFTGGKPAIPTFSNDPDANPGYHLTAIPAVVASTATVAGTDSVAATDVNAFLVAIRNDIALVAKHTESFTAKDTTDFKLSNFGLNVVASD